MIVDTAGKLQNLLKKVVKEREKGVNVKSEDSMVVSKRKHTICKLQIRKVDIKKKIRSLISVLTEDGKFHYEI